MPAFIPPDRILATEFTELTESSRCYGTPQHQRPPSSRCPPCPRRQTKPSLPTFLPPGPDPRRHALCGPNRGQPAKGSIFEPAQVTTRPNTEMAVNITVQVRNVSASVIPLSRFTTQNPLSFIHDVVNAPKPMAR